MQRVVKLFTLPQGDGRKDTIASLDCKENVVYIGTNNGLLQKWRLDQDSKDEDYVSRQLNQVQLKKRVVAQVITDPQWPRLFTLCDENVTVHSTEDLSRVFYITEDGGKTSPLKGCICMAVAPVYRNKHRICVATKKKLHLYNYQQDAANGQPSHFLFQVLVMPSSVCCLAFQGETLCCGYMKEYSLLNCYSGEATGLFTLHNQQPIIKSLDSEHAALCNVGNLSIRVSLKDAERKTSPASNRITRETIKWSSEPRSIGFKYPYVIGLLSDQVEIYSIYEGDIVQQLTNISGSILASVRCPGPSDNLCISTDRDVYMLVCADADSQVKQLVSKLMMTEAFDMLYRTSTGNEELDQERKQVTHVDAGFGFLFRGQPDSAFEHFAATAIDVREILVHFPELLPPNAKEEGGVLWNWQPSISSNDTSMTLEDRYIALLQDEAPPRQSQDEKESLSSNGLGASDPQLIFALEATMKQTINLLVLFMSARQESSDALQQRCMGYASLVVAINHNNKEETYKLLANRSFCDLRECAPKLEESGLSRELALLYFSKQMYPEAAQALKVNDKISTHCGEGIDCSRSTTREDLLTDLHEIYTAIESNEAEYVKRVLAADPNSIHLADSLGNTPFHHACAMSTDADNGIINDNDFMSMIGVLLNKKSDPNVQNKFGLSPLDVASKASTRLWGFIISFIEVQQLCDAIAPLKKT
eukprot:TRINITY_DN2020_c3_g1_i1.p1 TRINITY_DN2020_c3_g1~~TRINITY_DN2020_c3_g1_i1.p1  ORF type:complete len:703 (+),score=109.42 TRINITY_DN2020_c3_g1_i1:63-2171(+)